MCVALCTVWYGSSTLRRHTLIVTNPRTSNSQADSEVVSGSAQPKKEFKEEVIDQLMESSVIIDWFFMVHAHCSRQ